MVQCARKLLWRLTLPSLERPPRQQRILRTLKEFNSKSFFSPEGVCCCPGGWSCGDDRFLSDGKCARLRGAFADDADSTQTILGDFGGLSTTAGCRNSRSRSVQMSCSGSGHFLSLSPSLSLSLSLRGEDGNETFCDSEHVLGGRLGDNKRFYLGENALVSEGNVIDDAGSAQAIRDNSSGSPTAVRTSCLCCRSVRAFLCSKGRSSSGEKHSDPGGKSLGDSGS